MTDIPFTDAQMAALRVALGVPAGARNPVAEDLIVVAIAEDIARAEDARLDPPA